MSKLFFCSSLLVLFSACNSNNKPAENLAPPNKDSISKPESNIESPAMSDLPSFVAFRNWQIGDPSNATSVLNVYGTWDRSNTDSMAIYFADSATYDFPNGTRRITTRHTIEATFRKWRHDYTQTSNIPFSMISLHNKDLDQDWVIAWTWNKWQYTDGKKDSALYCDNWRIRAGKITYLNSMENRASKELAKRLNERISK